MDEILLDNFKMAMKYLCGENWTIKQNPETKKQKIVWDTDNSKLQPDLAAQVEGENPDNEVIDGAVVNEWRDKKKRNNSSRNQQQFVSAVVENRSCLLRVLE